MEQSKWQLILHENCEDPYYEITNGPISLIANCGFVGEDDADEENLFNRIKDELNVSGINFHSGNKLELQQHIEIQKQQYEIDDLQARCDRYENALKEIRFVHKSSDSSATWHLQQVQNVAIQALSGEGKEVDTRDKIALICHALAEEVAKDAGTAEEYLRKEGVDVDKVKEDAKFIAWLAELAALLHGAAQGQPIKINQEEARKWYDDGATPYQCFRETWNME